MATITRTAETVIETRTVVAAGVPWVTPNFTNRNEKGSTTTVSLRRATTSAGRDVFPVYYVHDDGTEREFHTSRTEAAGRKVFEATLARYAR